MSICAMHAAAISRAAQAPRGRLSRAGAWGLLWVCSLGPLVRGVALGTGERGEGGVWLGTCFFWGTVYTRSLVEGGG